MKIALLGDIGFLGEYTANTKGREKLKMIADFLKSYDYIVANLETPLTKREKTMVPKSMHLKADPNNVELLKLLCVNAVDLGNNHICDYGIQGLYDTIEALEMAGIEYYGINNKTHRIEKKNNKISFSGFCCYSANGSHYIGKKKVGVNVLTVHSVETQMNKDEDDGYFSILSLHWGEEHTNYPSVQQIEFAHNICQNRSMVIHGHHTHTVQGIEKLGDSIVAYSLGNFCFDDCTSPFVKNFTVKKNEENRESFILSLEIQNNKVVTYETIGIYDEEIGIVLKDNSIKISNISKRIDMYVEEEYTDMRKKQIADTRKSKFAKRNLKWLMSKMNYYSIGSRLGTYYNEYRMKRAYK